MIQPFLSSSLSYSYQEIKRFPLNPLAQTRNHVAFCVVCSLILANSYFPSLFHIKQRLSVSLVSTFQINSRFELNLWTTDY